MPLTSWRARLEDILAGMQRIERSMAGIGYDDFGADPALVRTVRLELAKISQTAAELPPDVSQLYPEVPWAVLWNLAGEHQADARVLWGLIRDQVPVLRAALISLLGRDD